MDLALSARQQLHGRAIVPRDIPTKAHPIFWSRRPIPLTARWISITHVPATYIGDSMAFIFGGIVFILGVVGAYAMVRLDSVWGPVLFHAGYDLLNFITILESL
jgi:membrane protease YdiL (CAAX protease family)